MRPAYGICRLGSGCETHYHVASPLDSKHVYDPQVFRYIGKGVIIKVEGKPIRDPEQLKFYQLRRGRK